MSYDFVQFVRLHRESNYLSSRFRWWLWFMRTEESESEHLESSFWSIVRLAQSISSSSSSSSSFKLLLVTMESGWLGSSTFRLLGVPEIESLSSSGFIVEVPSCFLCSSFSRSALRHLARRFWNHTWNLETHKLYYPSKLDAYIFSCMNKYLHFF